MTAAPHTVGTLLAGSIIDVERACWVIRSVGPIDFADTHCRPQLGTLHHREHYKARLVHPKAHMNDR
jgi:hypothetical protein